MPAGGGITRDVTCSVGSVTARTLHAGVLLAASGPAALLPLAGGSSGRSQRCSPCLGEAPGQERDSE